MLFELLVLNGMHRRLGYSGKVDAVTGQPDAVHEAGFYLRSHPWHQRPRPTHPGWKLHLISHAEFWSIVRAVVSVGGVFLITWWMYGDTSPALVWLEAFALALIACAAFIRDTKSYEPDLTTDKMYLKWLDRMAGGLNRKPAGTADADASSRSHAFTASRYTQSWVIARDTNFQVLDPDAWRRFSIHGQRRTLLYLFAGWLLLMTTLPPRIHTDNWMPPYFFLPLYFALGITEVSSRMNEFSLIPLRTYLIQHLLQQLQSVAPADPSHARAHELSM